MSVRECVCVCMYAKKECVTLPLQFQCSVGILRAVVVVSMLFFVLSHNVRCT